MDEGGGRPGQGQAHQYGRPQHRAGPHIRHVGSHTHTHTSDHGKEEPQNIVCIGRFSVRVVRQGGGSHGSPAAGVPQGPGELDVSFAVYFSFTFYLSFPQLHFFK